MEYVTVEEARERSGLRLVLSAHVPGPWGEAAKAILRHHGLAFIAVAQGAMQDNDALQEWTGMRNAPILVPDGETPISNWLDILMYAERMGGGPSLLPGGSNDRTAALGLSAEICAPFGFGWSRRIQMFEKVYGPGDLAADAPAGSVRICSQYGYSAAAVEPATRRVCDIMDHLAQRLEAQHAKGSRYLVGDRLSSCDLYWACFSPMVAEPAPHIMATSDGLRQVWSVMPARVAEHIHPALIEHRDFVWSEHIGIPADF